MPSEPKTNVSAARRPRNRCTRVVNIVNVNDSAKLPPTEAMDCAAGDQSSTPTDPRSAKRSQPLGNVNDHRQSPRNEPGSPNRHRDPPVIDKGLRLPQFNGTDWPSFIEEFKACVRYFQWPEQVKAIWLRTSLVGPARKALVTAPSMLWSYDQLKQHTESNSLAQTALSSRFKMTCLKSNVNLVNVCTNFMMKSLLLPTECPTA